MDKDISKLRRKDRLATIVHHADAIEDNAKHTNAHAQQIKNNPNKTSVKFNAKHAAHHSQKVLEKAKELKKHIKKYRSLDELEKELDGKVF